MFFGLDPVNKDSERVNTEPFLENEREAQVQREEHRNCDYVHVIHISVDTLAGRDTNTVPNAIDQ